MPGRHQIDRDLIEHLGELARISLPAEQQDQLCDKLQQLVEAFSTLAEIDDTPSKARSVATDSVAAKRHAEMRTASIADLRQDLHEPTPSTEQILANAPQSAAECFVVPRVLEP